MQTPKTVHAELCSRGRATSLAPMPNAQAKAIITDSAKILRQSALHASAMPWRLQDSTQPHRTATATEQPCHRRKLLEV